jgi:hypothetical protein
MKTGIQNCPNAAALATLEPNFDPDAPPPEFYLFERGRHREAIPVLGDEMSCIGSFLASVGPRLDDAARGYLAYGRDCGVSMVEIGRVDLKLGPETMKEPMADWLNSKFYNVTATTYEGTIDMDQWLKNFAFYSVLGNRDTVISNINNWYLATTEGGNNWRIVQWDHNTIVGDDGSLCGVECFFRPMTWPILRPSCGPNELHQILSKTLNTEENEQKFLDYSKEFVDVLTTSGIIEEMIEYGNIIKEYAAEDPLFQFLQDPVTLAGYTSVEQYEEKELTRNTDYSTDLTAPFVPSLLRRLEEVSQQLDAIEAGTLPRDGKYDPVTVCPDWRDENFIDYMSSFIQQQLDPSQILVESESCPPELATGLCKYDPLNPAGYSSCFTHSFACDFEGEFTWADCASELNPCAPCFPYSRCGGNLAPPEELVPLAPHGESVVDGTIVLETDGVLEVAVENTCELCLNFYYCFDHAIGCLEDGTTNPILFQCPPVMIPCSACFPNSRCAVSDTTPVADDSGMFVEGESCGPELAPCADAGPCFDHAQGCAEDGSMMFEDCAAAIPFCEPCFPFSRCGGDGGAPVAVDESATFVEGEDCGPELALCADAGPCFDHTIGCAEDGSMAIAECETALPFCAPCFPLSRCGSAGGVETPEVVTTPPDPPAETPVESGARHSLVSCMFSIVVAGLSWFWVVV